MKVVLTIPDGVKWVELYVKNKDGGVADSTIIRNGELTDSCFIDKGESINWRYVEGLEKRIDALETELREEVARKFDVVHETFVKLDGKVETLGRTVDSLDRWTDATDGQLKEIEKRLAKLEKPCVDAEALNVPKMKPAPDITLENRGPYADILRRLSELEERAKTSRPTWEYFNKLVERIEGLEGRVEPIESLLDKGEDGAYPFVPTFKDYAEIKKKIDALEEEVKISPATFSRYKYNEERLTDVIGNCVNNDERIEAIEKLLGKTEGRGFNRLVTFDTFSDLRSKVECLISKVEDVEKNAEVARGVRNITANEVKDLKIRLENVEKKAVVAEGVRKQLAEDIKGLQGRINKICEETLVDA